MGKLEYALVIVILGLTGVMIALFLLYLLFYLFGRFLNRPHEKAAVSLPGQAGAAHRLHIQAQGPSVSVEASGVRPAVVAAVMAAIYSCLETTPGRSFRVSVAVRPKQAAGVWGLEGRRLLMGGRTRIDLVRRQRKGEKV